jgi:sodium-dependent dicarboxylate transporter 2/3/5
MSEGGEAEEIALRAGATYRSLGEQRLSAREERFERARRTIGLFLGPLALLALYAMPMRIPRRQHDLAAILVFVMVYWITEAVPIPVTGLIGIALCVLLNVGPAREVVAGFGDPAIFLFIGAFIIAEAMLKHGVARRFAFRILSLPMVGSSTTRIVIAFGVATTALSAFISNTATVAMLLPSALGILATLATLIRRHDRARWEHATDADGAFDPSRLRVGTALMLMLAFGASVGGLLTPVGTPTNIIGRRLIEDATHTRIGFLQWVVIAAPISLVMFLVLALVLLLLNRPEIDRMPGIAEYVAREHARLGPLSVAERNTLIAFATAVVLWVLPGMVGVVSGIDSPLFGAVSERLNEGVVAVAAASLLFLLPTSWPRREFTLRWSDAVGIDWGTILLFGSGIVFGALLRQTGLAEGMGRAMAHLMGVGSALPITIFATVIAVVISETTSNTASVAVVVPIVLPVAAAAGVSPLVPGMAAVFGASFGFMLPVSTPQNAIVYGSGFVPITKMVRSGLVFDVLGVLIIVIGVPLMMGLVLSAP